MLYACLPSRASRLALLGVTMVTAGAGMSVESTRPAGMSTAAGGVATVLAPRAAVNTEREDVRRRRFRTEPAAAVSTVVASTVVAADRVSYGLYFRAAVTAGCPAVRRGLPSNPSSTTGPVGRAALTSGEESLEFAFANIRQISVRTEHQR